MVKRKSLPSLPGLDEDMKTVRIGASFTAPALTELEKQKLMPKLINVSATSDLFEERCKAYFANISKEVPVDGLELEIGFTYPNQELADNEDTNNPLVYPINVEDYVLYKHCLVYSRVARSFEEVNKSNKILFYFYDKETELANKLNEQKLILKAHTLIPTLLQNSMKVKQVYTIYNSLKNTPPEYNIENKNDAKGIEVSLFKYAQENPKLFTNIVNDKNAEYTFFISYALEKNIIKKLPNTNTIVFEKDDNAVTLGNSYVEAITFLKNEKNQVLYNEIKSTLSLITKMVTNISLDHSVTT